MLYKIYGAGFERSFSAPDNAHAVALAVRLAFKYRLYSWLLVGGDGQVIADHWGAPDGCE
ncbi:MAG: hypothetical protein IKS49_04855 [Actinomycetaceae bacterium]|nr:hypothetical protein [Clostridia bacterium]MBR6459474.1 hypothetical protein [Actinomycetaceae bacterium]